LLDTAREWLDRRAEDLNPDEKTFINWTTNDVYQIEKVIITAAELLPFARDPFAAEWRVVLYLNESATAPTDQISLAKLASVMVRIGHLD
jgi:hypothetical protein